MKQHSYAGVDALCGSNLLIGLQELKEDGLLAKSDLPGKIPVATVDYNQVATQGTRN